MNYLVYFWTIITVLYKNFKNVSCEPVLNIDFWREAYDKLDTVFVRLGDDTELSCIASMHAADSTLPTTPSYSWAVHGEEITDGRDVVQENGNLKIEYAESKDGGRYICTISGKGHPLHFEHHLIVYRIPTIFYETVLMYRPLQICSDSLIDSKTRQITDMLCPGSSPACPYSLSGKCTTDSSYKKSKVSELLLIYVAQVPTIHEKYYPQCGIVCVKDAIYNNLDQNYEAITTVIREENSAASQQLQFLPKLHNKIQKSECSAGYKMYKQVLCLPCSPGHYSERESRVCSPCAKDHYQPEWGMAQCHACPKHTVSLHTASTAIDQCEGSGTMHLDGAGVHVQVQSKTIKMYALITGVSSALAILLTLLIALIWNYKCRKPKVSNLVEKASSLLSGYDMPEEYPRPPKPLPRSSCMLSQAGDLDYPYGENEYTYAQEHTALRSESGYEIPQPPEASGYYDSAWSRQQGQYPANGMAPPATYSNIPDYITIQDSPRADTMFR